MKCLNCKNYLRQSHQYSIDFLNDAKRFECINMSCGYNYYNYVVVKENWWFAHSYIFYFVINNRHYCLAGNAGKFTNFKLFDGSVHNWIDIITISHYGLPVNEDFDKEIEKLVNRFKKSLILQ